MIATCNIGASVAAVDSAQCTETMCVHVYIFRPMEKQQVQQYLVD